MTRVENQVRSLYTAAMWLGHPAHNSELRVFRQIPNLLSVSRIPGSLALLILFDPRVPASIWISCLLTAAIITTDFLDGNFARKYALESKLGYLLDGLGDRAFHVTIYLILLISGVISLVLAWALIFREVSQYAVRLADVDWHKTQSKLDRAVTRSYATAVQVIFACETL